tara:strand:+ start:2188 stop:3072 length:885 start_codon:yes stop_codon:yes gene_type:complete
MPTVPFIGAARFQGHWNASTNSGTGSGLQGSAPGTAYTTLLVNGGYGGTTNLTASNGDYWQVTGSGAANIDNANQWALNDWIIYSGSSWVKLAFEDTIASIILGDMSTSVFHLGTANDKHMIFNTGSQHSGSSDFVYDYVLNRVGIGTSAPDDKLHVASGQIKLDQNKKIYWGGGQAAIKGGGDELILYSGDAEVIWCDTSQNVGIGTTDPQYKVDITGSLGVSGSAFITGDITIGGEIIGGTSLGASNFTTLQRNTTLEAQTATRINGPFSIPATLSLTLSVGARAQIDDIRE